MKKINIMLCICLMLTQGRAKSGFEIYGDVMLALPFVMMAYSYNIDDLQGVKEQAISTASVLLSTQAIKQGFVVLSRHDEAQARISQRPQNGSFDGFPSGHTSFVFSSVGFAQKRYGWRFSVPLGAIATSVGVSRIYAKRHTTAQVIAGAALGFGLSYLLSSRQVPINAWIQSHPNGHTSYHLAYFKAF